MPQEPWNAEEDELLYQLVQRLGPSSWSETARLLNSTLNVNRLAKQCRERWISHVDPRIRRGDWSLSEDRFILNQQNLWGNRWADIARHLPGRTTHAVKNRYHQLQRLLNQGKTKLETILNAPLIHVVPHFLQQTNCFKDSPGKKIEVGNQIRVKKTIIKKRRESIHSYGCLSEKESIEQFKKNKTVYSENEINCTQVELEIDKCDSKLNKKSVDNYNDFNNFVKRLEKNVKNDAETYKQEIQAIENVCKVIPSNAEMEFSPENFRHTCLEFQQSPPGVLLASDVGIYPVTPTFTENCNSYKTHNAIEPSTCETNQDEYISKSDFLTPSSELSESLSSKCIQPICTFNEDPSIYNEMDYRDPNWYVWNENSNGWDNNPIHRLDTGSIVDPFLHTFPDI